LFHKLLPLIISILGASFAYFLYAFGLEFFYTIKKTVLFKRIYNFLNRKWYFDRLYNEVFGQYALNLSYHFAYKNVDRGIIEKFGPSGIVSSIQSLISSLGTLQSGHIYHYLFLFSFAILLLIFIAIFFFHFFSIDIVFFLFFILFCI
jgi:NADH:ubiquinone oxidoreductase subunit 5 (subunit L)/multisubunit Na+/H+ antiporter MnhA subunit